MAALLEVEFPDDVPRILADPLLFGDFADYLRGGERLRLDTAGQSAPRRERMKAAPCCHGRHSATGSQQDDSRA